jgi:hypothetical protein
MKNRVFNSVLKSKMNIIREFTLERYGYILTEDTYLGLTRSRGATFDRLLCEYTNKKYKPQNPQNLNLHRWSLENREKTKNEYEYPW